ncbi:SGNH/GDSL hydrolase family protein [Salidesulfovibrio brasiliensis]|uniref:SGNH/GDSL hydrolase family protein n=1 Tax=Salidesulfovibrio brasiliensis TaxID=221711 RepID=UPI0006D00357|nr:SGNH/GDSL hydrolase family protein [Salidesulfovibrio brasiliensis]
MLNNTFTRAMKRLGLPGRTETAPAEPIRTAWSPPRAVADPDCILRGNPRHPGHDPQGFRNAQPLREADICVLGGSFAYGAGVGDEQCWPKLLGWIGDTTVFNAAFRGWGPMQAAIVIEEMLQRNPSRVILTLHSCDARRAFLGAARSRHELARTVWKPEYENVEVPTLLIKDMAAKAYRLERQANPDADPGELLAVIADRGVPDFNRFELGGARLYLADNVCRAAQAHGTHAVEAGHAVLKYCLEHIARMTQDAGAELTILLAPSREYVAFTRMHEAVVRSPETLRALGQTEARTMNRLKYACDNIRAEHYELTDALAAALPRRIFPQDSRDGNPSPKGCRLIAETVHRLL